MLQLFDRNVALCSSPSTSAILNAYLTSAPPIPQESFGDHMHPQVFRVFGLAITLGAS